MSDASLNAGPPPPDVKPETVREIASGVFFIPDHRVPLVPNVGVILGRDAALVVDSGMGPANGARILAAARKVAGGRKLILTLTHFHPEHGFGAQAFKGKADIVYNRAQRDELKAKGEGYIGMFKGFGPAVAAALEGTEIVMPDSVYEGGSHALDLGGRTVELRTWGPAHTAADEVVWLPAEKIVFVGDLAEERMFPIFPWFPPHDADIDAANWVRVLDEVIGWRPSIVVPGHGSVGGTDILKVVRDYLVDVGQRVAAGRKAGESPDAIVASLAPAIRAAYPGWDSPEWIDFAIRYHATLN
jgi:glyoxylase-like metal-dependent hydrolase (beta-lactamase superfamily II)